MNKVMSIVIVALMLGLLVFAGSHEHHSYSGSHHYLTMTGVVHISPDKDTLEYASNTPCLSEQELQCLVKLSKHYNIIVTDN